MSHSHSKACCETPPIISKGYETKGSYTTIDGLKTYSTGSSDAKKGILVIYDIFGFFPQTLQGADILAHSDKENPYQVFIPDFFEGKPADISIYPPDTKEKQQTLNEFFSTTAAPPKTVSRVPQVLKELQSKHPNIQTWGLVGYCWGGKVANLSAQSGSSFKAVASLHPAMVDAADAEKLVAPILLILSEGESKQDVEAYEKALKVKHESHWFPDQVHGFMAARSNLEDAKVKAAYEKGYQHLLNFFHENL